MSIPKNTPDLILKVNGFLFFELKIRTPFFPKQILKKLKILKLSFGLQIQILGVNLSQIPNLTLIYIRVYFIQLSILFKLAWQLKLLGLRIN
jgi:hypothetical protein